MCICGKADKTLAEMHCRHTREETEPGSLPPHCPAWRAAPRRHRARSGMEQHHLWKRTPRSIWKPPHVYAGSLTEPFYSVCFNTRRQTHEDAAEGPGTPVWGIPYPRTELSLASLCAPCFSQCYFPVCNLLCRQDWLTASPVAGCGKRRRGRAVAPLRWAWRHGGLQHPLPPRSGSNARQGSPAV